MGGERLYPKSVGQWTSKSEQIEPVLTQPHYAIHHGCHGLFPDPPYRSEPSLPPPMARPISNAFAVRIDLRPHWVVGLLLILSHGLLYVSIILLYLILSVLLVYISTPDLHP